MFSMSLDQVIAMSASIGAAFSAIATLLTVREMAKQRQASYRPELVFEGLRFVIRQASDQIEYPPSIWFPSEAAEGEDSRLAIELINIGLGAAKAVSLTWSFDVVKMIDRVNKLAQKSLAGTFVEMKNNAVSIKRKDQHHFTSMWSNQQFIQVDFVLPSDSAKSQTKVQLPHAYLILYSNFIHYSAVSGDLDDLDSVPLLVRIDYGDIGEKKFSLEYEILFNLSTIIGTTKEIFGNISIVRVNKSSLALEIAKDAAVLSATMALPLFGNFISIGKFRSRGDK